MQKPKLILLLTFCLGVASITSAADTHQPFKSSVLEKQIHELVNQERLRYGLTALHSDSRLATIARNHSIDMATQHYFSHYNPAGEDSSARAAHQGWNIRKQLDSNTVSTGVAENIYMTHLYDKIITTSRNNIPIKQQYIWKSQQQLVYSVVQGWMNSAAHRESILTPRYDRQGIGVAISGNEVYVTEDFF